MTDSSGDLDAYIEQLNRKTKNLLIRDDSTDKSSTHSLAIIKQKTVEAMVRDSLKPKARKEKLDLLEQKYLNSSKKPVFDLKSLDLSDSDTIQNIDLSQNQFSKKSKQQKKNVASKPIGDESRTMDQNFHGKLSQIQKPKISSSQRENYVAEPKESLSFEGRESESNTCMERAGGDSSLINLLSLGKLIGKKSLSSSSSFIQRTSSYEEIHTIDDIPDISPAALNELVSYRTNSDKSKSSAVDKKDKFPASCEAKVRKLRKNDIIYQGSKDITSATNMELERERKTRKTKKKKSVRRSNSSEEPTSFQESIITTSAASSHQFKRKSKNHRHTYLSKIADIIVQQRPDLLPLMLEASISSPLRGEASMTPFLPPPPHFSHHGHHYMTPSLTLKIDDTIKRTVDLTRQFLDTQKTFSEAFMKTLASAPRYKRIKRTEEVIRGLDQR